MQILKSSAQSKELQQELSQNFSQIFWDIHPEQLDFQKHYKLIITQVFNYGSVPLITVLFDLYSLESIKDSLSAPIRGVWFPQTYRAFCNLLEVEQQPSALNFLCLQKKTQTSINQLFGNTVTPQHERPTS